MIVINKHSGKFEKRALVTVQVLYLMPQYTHLVQEFLWQCDDFIPTYPRVNQFLHYWYHEIDAIIKEVYVCDSTGNDASKNFSRYEFSLGLNG
jgi:uncharacterized protein Usg